MIGMMNHRLKTINDVITNVIMYQIMIIKMINDNANIIINDDNK